MKTAAAQIFKARLVVGLLTIVSLTVLSTGQAAAQGVIEISSCPYIIVAPGQYRVTQDLFCPGNGIRIQSSDVKLNLGGHTITGSLAQTGIGIWVGTLGFGTVNVEIRNGTITNFTVGLSLEGTNATQIEALTSTRNAGAGIQLGFAHDNTITSSDVSDNLGSGVTLDRSTGNVFRGNRVIGNSLAGYALITFSSDNLITSSRASASIIEGNQNFGVVIREGNTNNTVQSSQLLGNTFDGILLRGANNTVKGNTVNGNARGINASLGATANIIVSNTAKNNVVFDLQDDNPNCDANVWQNNNFNTANQPQCID